MFEPKHPKLIAVAIRGQGPHNSSAPRAVGQNALPRRVFAAATAAMVLGLCFQGAALFRSDTASYYE